MQKEANTRDQAKEVKALQDTIYVIGGKWRIPIINSICNGNHRFREIERSIPGITTRMLSRELKQLEINKLIVRKTSIESVKDVEYGSTSYCKSLAPVIEAMIQWGKNHKKFIV